MMGVEYVTIIRARVKVTVVVTGCKDVFVGIIVIIGIVVVIVIVIAPVEEHVVVVCAVVYHLA